MENIISIKNLTIRDTISYPDFDIKKGEIVFLTGESGSGKSSLLKLFNMTENPSSGKIYYNAQNLHFMDTVEVRKKILLAGQEAYLFSGTIRENFIKYYEYLGLNNLEKSQMLNFLRICKVDFDVDEKCDEMSGGERQRVFLAIALSLNPEVLMLDEPTSALDEKTSKELIQNIVEFCKAKAITLIVVSHNRVLAEVFAEKLINMEEGVCEGCSRDRNN